MATGNTTVLKQVDKLVRDGNLAAALSLIQKVRSEDPENQYALAYEERVRSLLGPTDVDTQRTPAAVRQTPSPVPSPPGLQGRTAEAAGAGPAPSVPLAEIVGLFSRAYEALSRSDFRGALDTLGQARQLDPTNDDITVLEEQIRAACSAPTMSHTREDHRAIVQSTIEAYVDEATDLAGRGLFDEAMHLVARGFILDPADAGLLECERLINTSRELLEKRDEAEEYARAYVERMNQARRTTTAAVRDHARQASELFTGGAFDDALTEVALGLLNEPGSAALQELERRIWNAKREQGSSSATVRTTGECSHLIHLHLLAADEFARCADFTRALDSLAKAYVIDPTNVEVKRTEVRIRQQELRHHQQSSAPPLKLIYHHDRVANGE